jgi:hypothetical protein
MRRIDSRRETQQHAAWAGVRAAVAIAWLGLMPTPGLAQNTGHLITAREFGRFEAALGREVVGDVYSGSVTGAYGAYRAIVEPNSSWRVMGWSLWRDRKGSDANGQPVDIEHRAIVLAAGPEFRTPIPLRQSWFGGFLGAGYARVHASHPEFVYSSQGFEKSGNGWALVAGFGLTMRRVIVQQHVVIIHGAMNTLQVNREYYPVMLGVRF